MLVSTSRRNRLSFGLSLLGNGEDRQEKFAIARTRSPTREPRVLPKPLRGLHLHDLGFFVLEMIIDGFDEAVGKFLHFAFHVAQLILGQTAGRL